MTRNVVYHGGYNSIYYDDTYLYHVPSCTWTRVISGNSSAGETLLNQLPSSIESIKLNDINNNSNIDNDENDKSNDIVENDSVPVQPTQTPIKSLISKVTSVIFPAKQQQQQQQQQEPVKKTPVPAQLGKDYKQQQQQQKVPTSSPLQPNTRFFSNKSVPVHKVAYHGSVLIENEMLIYGGDAGGHVCSTAYTFNIDELCWYPVELMLVPPRINNSLVSDNTKVYEKSSTAAVAAEQKQQLDRKLPKCQAHSVHYRTNGKSTSTSPFHEIVIYAGTHYNKQWQLYSLLMRNRRRAWTLEKSKHAYLDVLIQFHNNSNKK